jgi:ADP-heptose:LPS heptosyltransferase
VEQRQGKALGIAEMLERGLGPDPATVGRLVVLCPGGLGTIIRAVPALRHLRRTYLDAQFTIVVDQRVLDIVESCPYVDRCIDQSQPSEVLLEQFDLAVSLADPDEHAKVPSFTRIRLAAIDATVRAAWAGVEDDADLVVRPEWPRRLSHASRMLRLAWLIGGEHPDPRLTVWPRLADRNGAAQLAASLPDDRPLALVHVADGGGDEPELAAAFLRTSTVLHELGCAVGLVGTARDAIDPELPLPAGIGHVENWIDRTSTGVLAALMERASLFVGIESGPAVLARALGLQSVVVGNPDTHELHLQAGRVAWVTPNAGRLTADSLIGFSTRAASRAVSEWTRLQL